MLRIILSIVYFVVCAGAIATFVSSNDAILPQIVAKHPLASFFGLLLVTQLVTLIDWLTTRKRIEVVSAVYFGLMIGFLLAFLLLQALEPLLMNSAWRNPVVILTTLALPYLCISLLIQTKDDFRFLIPYVEFSREVKGGRPIVIDSSSLIDGRVAEVVETRILDAEILVPDFVLREVQDIADSGDKVRRTRGRRGLEVLATLQNNPRLDVRVLELSDREAKDQSVDQRLIDLARREDARLMTNDFNLNKVAGVQGIDVINLNDVANALKPRFLPGERLKIRVIKEGEGHGQGVGYLEDGTMVVCEHASTLIGREIDVIVTSLLQSSAGRMIFGRQVHTTNRNSDSRAES